jgi:hypothetical protein
MGAAVVVQGARHADDYRGDENYQTEDDNHESSE